MPQLSLPELPPEALNPFPGAKPREVEIADRILNSHTMKRIKEEVRCGC